ncbi:GNAT family protein [Glutamicibacter sp.]|uniref:GNAT family N-acetyltransferase n=1 Tax=Glutamicibacter sp. TaxID=1931995 RepID=UPI0028BF2945|nr:GNAT family protein [Glutamicibacter sp.]
MEPEASVALVAPTIEAHPYRLRPFSMSDTGLIARAGKDPHIPLITSVPTSDDPTLLQAFIQRQHRRLINRSGYSLAIADAATDQAVGQVGRWLHNLTHGIASIGYWVDPEQRRRGAAGHALAAMSRWGLSQPHIDRLELYLEPWNEGSWHTAESCGYQREGLMRSWRRIAGQRKDLFMYSLLPSDLPSTAGG